MHVSASHRFNEDGVHWSQWSIQIVIEKLKFIQKISRILN
jgi:hypothetical protein